jgi:hypothetical protein
MCKLNDTAAIIELFFVRIALTKNTLIISIPVENLTKRALKSFSKIISPK